MSDLVVNVKTAHVNLSPILFRKNSQDYLKAYEDFIPPNRFSPIPFFLCCRSIELALKAIHLESRTRQHVKKLYSHDLEKSYKDLDPAFQILNDAERRLLSEANAIYKEKEFEYLRSGPAFSDTI